MTLPQSVSKRIEELADAAQANGRINVENHRHNVYIEGARAIAAEILADAEKLVGFVNQSRTWFYRHGDHGHCEKSTELLAEWNEKYGKNK